MNECWCGTLADTISGMASCKFCVDKLKLQVGEMRIALEIASPSMAHTFSGHVYEDGKPVEWVDGCGKCRVMKILSTTEKRKCPVCEGRHPELCSACMGSGLEG